MDKWTEVGAKQYNPLQGTTACELSGLGYTQNSEKYTRPNVEIRYTELASICRNEHRFYALEEMISNESTKTSLIALACTQCGSLIIHAVQAK